VQTDAKVRRPRRPDRKPDLPAGLLSQEAHAAADPAALRWLAELLRRGESAGKPVQETACRE
jgi:hypothetical protein